jgi:hypothetical protein
VTGTAAWILAVIVVVIKMLVKSAPPCEKGAGLWPARRSFREPIGTGGTNFKSAPGLLRKPLHFAGAGQRRRNGFQKLSAKKPPESEILTRTPFILSKGKI